MIRSHGLKSRVCRSLMMSVGLLVLAGCASQRFEEPELSPQQARAQIVRLMPADVSDRQAWATDIHAAFAAQKIPLTTENICSVLAVTEQESTFQVDPAVPNMGRIARAEIDRRAARLHIPNALIATALRVRSPDGKTCGKRLDSAHTEKDLSAIFDDFIGMVPLGGVVRQLQPGQDRRADAGCDCLRRKARRGLSLPG